ncbi:putative stress-induced transcription regulator [Thermoflavifilum aggregans]|uniref:Putative stress-induced transcription regulator n=1 Tax=Thermoflavifilum aggregans TaxID=454188 RepID=A0A2M9CX51_9BACT|nr:CGNR zinc finger domain-containing protein [Thermoflavifilum aggregans]PJJ76481.1 putative stress-induced transcription regulator [Thermoflavifilum aggregans]
MNQKWKFIGGNLAIDFVNTIGGRSERNIQDYVIRDDTFNCYKSFVEWSEAIRLIKPAAARKIKAWAAENPTHAKKELKRVIAFRETLYRIFRHTMEKSKPDAVDIQLLNKEYAAARQHQQMIFSSGIWSMQWLVDADHPDRLVYQLAMAAADLLLSEKLVRLKQCQGEDCGWLFLDTSKNQKRIWCDMKDCGNLAKVRRFRSRHVAG